MANYSERFWMDGPRVDEATGEITEEYDAGLRRFMEFAAYRSVTMETGKMYCPCNTCQNMKFIPVKNVWSHLFRRGFLPSYKIWYSHGEDGTNINFGNYSGVGSSNLGGDIGNLGNEEVEVNLGSGGFSGLGAATTNMDEINLGTVQMVNDAFREEELVFTAAIERGEEPNLDARNFFGMLDAANKPLYSGCGDGVSPLSIAAAMMNIKTD